MNIKLNTTDKTILLLDAGINIEDFLVELEKLNINFIEWSLITEKPIIYTNSVFPYDNISSCSGSGSVNPYPFSSTSVTNSSSCNK